MLLKLIYEYRDAVIASLIIINLFSFSLCAYDKRAAIVRQKRVPESFLLAITFLYGSFGILSSMYLFRHKTKKPKFFITVPLCLIMQIASVYFVKILL